MERIDRPWGYYEILASGEGWQVKKLVIHPNQATSLQYHRRRSERLNVVKGVLSLIRDQAEFLLSKEESKMISPTEVHRLTNNHGQDLTIIEIQYGHISEEDIVRLEDRYGRCSTPS